MSDDTQKAPKEIKFHLKPFLMGTFLGGIVMFVFVMASWMVLPFHMNTLNSFKDTTAVSEVLLANTQGPGIYTIPNCTECSASKSDVKPLPKAFVSFYPEGFNPSDMPQYMAIELLTCLASSAILTFMTLMLVGSGATLGFGCKVRFIFGVGLLIAIASYIPNWNWWKFPLDFTLVGMLDTLIATLLAGFVIAKVTPSADRCSVLKF